MKNKSKVSVFWFRRDLRLQDNHGLNEALKSGFPVLPLFIFDREITDELERDDPRITFIYNTLQELSISLAEFSSGIICKKGHPLDIWKELLTEFNIHAVFTNEDYEPYAIQRDLKVRKVLSAHNVPLYLHKDQVIFAKDEVLKSDQTPYTVFTPYKNKWLVNLENKTISKFTLNASPNYAKNKRPFPTMSALGFTRSSIKVRDFDLNHLENYEEVRNFPALNQTSGLSTHLRFGTISIRQVINSVRTKRVFLSELIWREFFMQILFHFPAVVEHNFKRKYDHIEWRNDAHEFEKWKNGSTGYPIVDAGMRELNQTGYMHNRVRMITAGFLCKHLLIDWKWGEAYFAKKLLDYELSSNNGNWQWAAGTGCDAAPYFRIFNPTTQVKKFDPQLDYIKKWIPEIDSLLYPTPIVEHKFARERAIKTYKEGLQNYAGYSNIG